MQSDSTPDPGTTPESRLLYLAAVQAWLGSGTWPATIATVAVVTGLAVLSLVLIPILWGAVGVVYAFNAVRDRIPERTR